MSKKELKAKLAEEFGIDPEHLQDHSKKDLEGTLSRLRKAASEKAAKQKEVKADPAPEAPKKEEVKADPAPEAPKKEEIPESAIAEFKNERSESFCGTFSNPDMNSPICAKECAEMFEQRHIFCLAMHQQAKKAAPVKSKTTRARTGSGGIYKKSFEEVVSLGNMTRKQIVDSLLNKHPEAAKSTFTTYLSDGQSEKYCPFDRLLAIDKATGIVAWSEKKALGSRSAMEKAYATRPKK